jgi:2-polyprenyl-6-methoxyphenol hydroxylase-like FAD-dependent oxidoreductase
MCSAFRIPYVDAKALIEATPEFWEYPMCDRDPLPRWTHSRVTLLGDAAHPMYPVGSNGASQAILDARCLADRLVSAEHAVHALWQYEQERLPPTAQIVKMNRSGGPEGVIDAVEQRAPDGFSNIEDVLPFEQRKAIVRGYAGRQASLRPKSTRPARRRSFRAVCGGHLNLHGSGYWSAHAKNSYARSGEPLADASQKRC